MKKWATTTAALALGLVATLTSTSATFVQFKEVLMAMSPHERNRIAFNEYEPKPPQHYLLSSATADDEEPMECSTTETYRNGSGTSEILVAISKCLNQSSINAIKAWIEETKTARATYLDPQGNPLDLTFTTTLMDDNCEALNERNRRGLNDTSGYKSLTLLSDGTDYMMSQQVLPQEVERIQAFARFGRVLASAPEVNAATADPTNIPIAVISFVNNNVSYDYITQYESKLKISKTFNFQVCQDGTACETTFENCIPIQEDVDLFMYNPFQIVRSTSCPGLTGGLPVTYINATTNEHSCYCACPAGQKKVNSECVKNTPETCDCVWAPAPYHIDNTENLGTCLFSNLSSCHHVDVPFPLDNYVADFRTNRNDGQSDSDLAKGPHIDLIVTQQLATIYSYESLNNYYRAAQAQTPYASVVDLTSDDICKEKFVDQLDHLDGDVGGLTPPTPTTTTGPGTPVIRPYDWKDYQQNRTTKINSIEITAYGKYALKLQAFDYVETRNATCLGCVEIVDQYRPRNTTTCPLRVCDNTTDACSTSTAGHVEYSEAKLTQLQELVAGVYTFVSNATNDACNTARCDRKVSYVKNWFDASYPTQPSTTFDGSNQCFSQTEFENSFKDSADAIKNPLKKQNGTAKPKGEVPVAPLRCNRCCKYGVELKEWWVDYKCGYDYDIKRCSGLDNHQSKCDLEQCVVLHGDTLASATANIKAAVKTESEAVLSKLVVEGFQTYTQVHRALPCVNFNETDPACSYSASVADLFDKASDVKFAKATGKEYVFWRYSIGTGGWSLWEGTIPEYTFNKPVTPVIIEAWTACGRVREFKFYVHLHPHSDIAVCDYFKGMWYQTSVIRADAPSTELCAYPGSDFAELTFDYQANIGLKYARDRLRMNISNVQCSLKFEGLSETSILNVTRDSMDILERYAVELRTLERTAPNTKFSVSCIFTYKQYGTASTTRTCDRNFIITDCDAPTIDTPPTSQCMWDDCAGKSLPGPYQVCDGNFVSSTATKTVLSTTSSECCQSCGTTDTECKSILGLPTGNKDIKRCVPPPPAAEAYGVYGPTTTGTDSYADTPPTVAIYEQLMLAKMAANHPTAAAATVLLAASAMVALVAMLVVRQRRVVREDAMIVDDAYYPLLN